MSDYVEVRRYEEVNLLDDVGTLEELTSIALLIKRAELPKPMQDVSDNDLIYIGRDVFALIRKTHLETFPREARFARIIDESDNPGMLVPIKPDKYSTFLP